MLSGPSRRRAAACAAAVLGLLAPLAIGAGPADAAFIHSNAPSEHFGTDGTSSTPFGRYYGGGLAVDTTSHRLYAFQNGDSKVYGFEIPTPGTHTAIAGNFPLKLGGQFENSTEKGSLAIDSETGDVYATNLHELDGFNPEGELLPGFPITSGLTRPCGVSTDAEGNVWVADSEEKQLREYTGTGEFIRAINTSTVFQPEFGAGMACNVAVDKSTDDLYFTLNPNYGANYIVWRLKASDNYAVASVEKFVANPGFPGITNMSIDSSRHVIYMAEGSFIRAYNTSGALLEEFGTEIEPQTVAVDETTGIVYASIANFNATPSGIQVFEPEIIPDAFTGEPTGDSQISGTVGTAGGPAVTECKFEWGTSDSYGNELPCSPAPPYGASDAVTANLPGLTKETTYHYRLVAENANGTNLGIDKTITPHYVSFLRTTAATEIERNCVKLNGAYDGNGEDTHFNFEWGTTNAYGNKVFPTDADAGSSPGPQSESFVLCGLSPATTYHYRFTASNGLGSTAGNDVTFKTENAVLGIATDPATEIGGVSAKINGHWTGDGSATSYYFEWGYSKAYGNKTPVVEAGSETGPQNGSADLTGLFQNTVYHYRIVVTNGTGTTAGPDRFFRSLVLASFTYGPTDKLTTESAELHARVNPENAGPTTYHFEYGPTESYGTQTPESTSVGSDNKPHQAAAAISGLSAGQTYHFRIVASSPAGISYGPDETFTAAPNLPTVVSESVSGFNSTEASLTAEARPGFGPTVLFFRYGVDGNFRAHSLTSPPIGSDDTPHSVTLAIGGLKPGTTYEYFAVAVNLAGSSLGQVRSFTTSDKPSAENTGASNLTQTSATLGGIVRPNLAATTYHFEYGVASASESTTAETSVGSDNVSHDVSATVSGLKPGTTYRYVIVATNSVGTTSSSEGTFATSAAPKEEPKPLVCKKGFVKRGGRCVKKPKHHHRKRHHKKKHHGKAHRNG